MIVLDTNVLSELRLPNPDPNVATWFAALPSALANGDQTQPSAGIQAMRTLADPAPALMQTPLPGGGGNYGPDFRLLT